MASERRERGAAQRGRSFIRVLGALLEADHRPLSFSDIVRASGLTRKTVSKTLERMVVAGTVLREVLPTHPPKVQYVFIEGLSEERIRELKSEYDGNLAELYRFLDKVSAAEINAKDKEVAHLWETYRSQRGATEPIWGDQQALKVLYYKRLREAQRQLMDCLWRQADDSERYIPVTCGNCVFGRKVDAKIDGQPAIWCRKDWQEGGRGLEREHPSGHSCDKFVRRPLSSFDNLKTT